VPRRDDLTRLTKPDKLLHMSKSKKIKTGSAVHRAALSAPARTIQSAPKVSSKRACRRNKYGRYDD